MKEKLMFIGKCPLLFTKMSRGSYTYRYLEFWEYIRHLPQIILYRLKRLIKGGKGK